MSEEAASEGYQTMSGIPSPMNRYGSSIITLTNPEEELRKLELTFKGKRMDTRGKIVDFAEPLCNDLGAERIVGHVRSLVNRVGIMSNLEKNDIPNLMMSFNDALIRELLRHKKKYGCIHNRDTILNMANNLTYLCLRRAYMEGDKRFWKGSVQEIHSRVEQGNAKKNTLQSLNPFR
jgi:hypothetical protein